MTASLVSTASFGFADGNAGHSCALGSAPSVGQWDILCVNSDTLVSTPSGFTLLASRVANQGAYVFGRKATGGESSSVTIITSGNFNCEVIHSRWDNVNAFDASGTAGVDALDGAGDPDATTGALAETGELVILFGANHAIFTANQSAFTYTSGYTQLATNVQGSGGPGCLGLVAYRTDGGTAAVTAGVTGWSGDGARDRYTLVVTFTTTASGQNGSGTATLPSLTASGSGTKTMNGTGAATLPSLTAAGSGSLSLSGTGTATLPSLTASGAGTQPLNGSGTATPPRLTASGSGTNAASGALSQIRSDLADCLSAVPGFSGHAEMPKVLTAGQGWPLLTRVDFSRYVEVEWRVIVVLGKTPAEAIRMIERLMTDAKTAFAEVMHVDEIVPVSLAYGSGELLGAEIRGRREL